MATESITLELNTETDWDGASLTTVNRDNAIVTGQRYYKFNITGPHGQIAADLGGLFSAVSVKLLGIASSSWNPESRAAIIASDATGSFRQQITLKPTIQYVVMYPGDKLAIVTKDGGRGQVVLVVNELNEQEAVTWGAHHGPFVMPTRFRIIRDTGTAFAPNLGNIWQPTFLYDSSTGLIVANDNGTGIIPSSSLCLYPRWQGCFVTIRYAGHNNNGKLHMVDYVTRRSWVAESGMTDVKWSKVQFISHDDGIALEATAAGVGQTMVCDIEVALVHPGNRLCGRYQGASNMLLDRHRVARLVELSAMERTIKGPERELREQDVEVLVKAAYDDATDAARAEFMARVQKMPTSAWPWSAVQATAPRGGGGGGLGGLIGVPKPVTPTTPAVLVLIRGQADSADADPGNRLPDRGTPGAAEWEPLHKALDTWATPAITKAIGPQGWISIIGSTAGQVPKDTRGATEGAPPNGPGLGTPPGPGPSTPPGDVPATQSPAAPTEITWKHPAVIAAGAAVVVAAGVAVYSLGQNRSRRQLEDVLAEQEEQP